MVAKLKTKAKSKLKVKKGTAKIVKAKSLAEAIGDNVIPMGELQTHIKEAKGVLDGYNKQYKVHTDFVSEQADLFLDDDEKESVSVGDFTVNVSAKKKTAQIVDKDAVIMALEGIEEGLSLKVAMFGIGELRKYFTPDEFDNQTEIVLGNRTIKM